MVISNNKLGMRIYSFGLHEKHIFQGAKIKSFQPLALAGLVAGISGSYPGYSGSIPRQGIKILFHASALCCLAEIVLTSPHVAHADTLTLHCSMNTS